MLARTVVAAIPAFACLNAGAASVTLAWDPNAETNVTGYRLYFGTSSRHYDGFIDVAAAFDGTQVRVPGLETGVKYFFAVTARTNDGLESDYSAEVFYTAPGEPPTEVPPPEPFVYSFEKRLISWPVLAAYLDELETSIDLQNWSVISTGEQRTGRYLYTPEVNPLEPGRFFRLRRVHR